MIKTNKYFLIIALLLIITSSINADDNVWSINGPTGARVFTIAIHPFDNQNIFIGNIENGIYETTDGGAVWNHIETDIRTLYARYQNSPDRTGHDVCRNG